MTRKYLAIVLCLLSTTCVCANDIIIVTDLLEGKIWYSPSVETLYFVEIPLLNISRPTAVDYDPIDQMVYWTDTDTHTINRAYLINGTNQEIIVQLPSSSVPEGLVLDVENRLLYWTDNGTDTIEKSDINGRNKETLFDLGLQKPRAIVLDSSAGYLYWPDWGSVPKIERGRIDGSERVVLVDTDIQYPNGLAIDYEDQKLYWCDAGLERIEFIYLNGSGRDINYDPVVTFHPFDIGVYKEYLYWTDWQFSQVAQIERRSGFAQPIGPRIFRRAGGLHIYREIDECTKNPCKNNGVCMDIVNGYTCDCASTGYQGKTCQEDINECNSDPCENDGLCVDMVNGYTCDCASTGYQGQRCTEDIDECQQSSVVCDSKAVCINTVGSFMCQCTDGFSGDGIVCTETNTPETSTSGDNPKSSTSAGTIKPSTRIPGCYHTGSIEHGHVAPTDSQNTFLLPTEKVSYSCEEHFSLVGNKEVFCLKDLSWSSTKPVCKAADYKGQPDDKGAITIAVGAIVGGILALVFIVVCVVCLINKRRNHFLRRQSTNSVMNLSTVSTNQLYDVTIQTPNAQNNVNDTYEEIPNHTSNREASSSQPSGQALSHPQHVHALEEVTARGQPSLETATHPIVVVKAENRNGRTGINDRVSNWRARSCRSLSSHMSHESANIAVTGDHNTVVRAEGNATVTISDPNNYEMKMKIEALEQQVATLIDQNAKLFQAVSEKLAMIEIFFAANDMGKIDRIGYGSVYLFIRFSKRQQLERFWKMYENGNLQAEITKIILAAKSQIGSQTSHAEDMSNLNMKVSIDEAEYLRGLMHFDQGVDLLIAGDSRQGEQDYETPCKNSQLVQIPVGIKERLDLTEEWRHVLRKPDVLAYLKPILTVDYLVHFPDMTIPDQEEIKTNYQNHPQRAADVFIEKLSRMELRAANRLLEALCANGQHDLHKYLYERLMTPPVPVNDGAVATFPAVEAPDMSESEIIVQQLHQKIWTDVVGKQMIELRKLPFPAVYKVFSTLHDFDAQFARGFLEERQTRGDTRAVEWLIRNIMKTELRWPDAFMTVLKDRNKPLLNTIKHEFHVRHQDSECVCNVRNRLPSTKEQLAIETSRL